VFAAESIARAHCRSKPTKSRIQRRKTVGYWREHARGMRQVNQATKALVIVIAIGCAVAAARLLRPSSPRSPPPPWMVDAAVAMSRADIAATGHARDASAAYREAVRVNPMDADAWADLADSLAAAAGGDLGAGQQAIRHALAIDPKHRKALWLRASLELQQKRFADAAASWRELQALVTPGSADARVIAANIVEADALEAATSGSARE
jgi:tetratricopeptide (TPR) repeat protein